MEEKMLYTIREIHESIKLGYTEYSIYFWVTSISIIIGEQLHAAGLTAFVITLVFFYFLGKWHKNVVQSPSPTHNIP